MKRVLAIFTLWSMAFVSVFAAPAPSGDGAKKDAKPLLGGGLDDELLKDLGGIPDEKPSASPKAQPVKKPDAEQPSSRVKPADRKPPNPLDDELLKELGGPEPRGPMKTDAKQGQGSEPTSADSDENPFTRINRQMRGVEERLRQTESGQPTQEMQQRIVKDLDELIEQLAQQHQKQQQNSQSQSSATQSRDVLQPDQNHNQQQQQAGQASQRPSDSSDKLTDKKAEKPETRSAEDAWKELWGHLPPRLREQMMQSSRERFLPKYEVLIEEYFKSLAETEK